MFSALLFAVDYIILLCVRMASVAVVECDAIVNFIVMFVLTLQKWFLLQPTHIYYDNYFYYDNYCRCHCYCYR